MTSLAHPAPLANALAHLSAELAPRSRATYMASLRAVRAEIEAAGGPALPDDVALLALLTQAGKSQAWALVSTVRGRWKDAGKAPATINSRLAALRKLLVVARNLGLVDWALEIPSVKSRPVRDMAGPTEEQYAAIVAACVTPVERAVVLLMGERGLRTAEVASLRAVDVEEGAVAVHAARKGHGGSRDRLTLHGTARAALRAVVAQDRGSDPEAPVLGLTRRGLRTVLLGVSKRAGVFFRPHGLRHRAGTQAHRRHPGDIAAVAAFMGHADTKTTLRYIDRLSAAAERVARAVGEEE